MFLYNIELIAIWGIPITPTPTNTQNDDTYFAVKLPSAPKGVIIFSFIATKLFVIFSIPPPNDITEYSNIIVEKIIIKPWIISVIKIFFNPPNTTQNTIITDINTTPVL